MRILYVHKTGQLAVLLDENSRETRECVSPERSLKEKFNPSQQESTESKPYLTTVSKKAPRPFCLSTLK